MKIGRPCQLGKLPTKTRVEDATEAPQASPDSFHLSENRDFPACQLLNAEGLSAEKRRHVRAVVQRAVSFFDHNFGSVTRPVRLRVGGNAGALRTGFNIKDDVINFPIRTSDGKSGLDSDDIITHEVFHALTLQAYPELCTHERITEPEFVRFHEGLADYFTHKLYPDPNFAEGYPEDRPQIRQYRNSRKISLSSGGHYQGNAITSYLLKHNIQPSQVRDFMAGGELSLKALGALSPALETELQHDASLLVKEEIDNYPTSELRKYWLKKNRPLGVGFFPNAPLRQNHPNLSVTWVKPNGMPSQTFRMEPTGQRSYEISPMKTDQAEKVMAVFKDGDQVLGARPFYFGNSDRLSSAEQEDGEIDRLDTFY